MINKDLFEIQIVEKIKNGFKNSPSVWRFDVTGYGSYVIRDDGLRIYMSDTTASLNDPIKYDFSPANGRKIFEIFEEAISREKEKKIEDNMKNLSLLFDIDRNSKMKRINSKIKKK